MGYNNQLGYPNYPPFASIELSTESGLCGALANHDDLAGETHLSISLFQQGSTFLNGFPTAGSYVIEGDSDSQQVFQAYFHHMDAACEESQQQCASDGKVRITAIHRGDTVEGTFDPRFDGGRLTGCFNTPFCPPTQPRDYADGGGGCVADAGPPPGDGGPP